MECKIIKKGLKGFSGDAWLVSFPKKVSVKDYDEEEICKTKYFVVSGTHAMFTGWEVLVFPSDKNGIVLDFGEVAGGRGETHKSAIADLEFIFNKGI